jgi:OOP family OmpA-OmpF porin
MGNATNDRTSRSRRSVLLGGVVALGAVYAIGAVVQLPLVEADLGSRVEQRLALDGVQVTAEFSGQDGTLRCDAALVDPEGAVSAAEGVWGVRSIRTEPQCAAAGLPPGGASSREPVTTDQSIPQASSTEASVTASSTDPPTTDPPTTDPPTTVAEAVVLRARLADGQVVLSGAVGSDLERLVLVQQANTVVAPANVANQLTVDPLTPILPADRFAAFVGLLTSMPLQLVTGELGWNGSDVSVSGSYADDRSRAAFAATADQLGVGVALDERAAATAASAAAMESDLNALVAGEPILFDKGATTISLASLATMQKVAGIAKRVAGVIIEVQGHTDSEGDPGRNLTLSEQRAASVLDALVLLGVPAADLVANGFGMTQLITDAAGKEIPDKSRRVVFAVTIT